MTGFKVEQTVGGLQLTWNESAELDIDHYKIFVGDISNLVATVSGTSYFHPSSTGGFTFFIRAIDTAGNQSEVISEYATISRPSQVQGFNAYQNGSDIEFVWEQNVGESVSYEIRRGTTWDTGEVVARVNGGFAKMSFAINGEHKFWIKAKSLYGVYSSQATWGTIDIAPTSDRNNIFSLNPSYVWDGVKYNVDMVGGGLQLRAGVIRGEYIQPIHLPFKCSARNWIDSTILAVVADGTTWGDASFSWDNSKSNSPWLPGGSNAEGMYIKNQIALYQGIPESCIESFNLSGSVSGEKGTAPSRAEKIAYQQGRFTNGLVVNESTFVKWDAVSIPTIFSLAFTLKVNTGLNEDTGYLTLRNDSNNWLFIWYNKSKNCFSLSGSDGKVIELDIEVANQDFVTLGISQGATKRRLLGYSLSKGQKVAEEISATGIGVFTSMALYANI